MYFLLFAEEPNDNGRSNADSHPTFTREKQEFLARSSSQPTLLINKKEIEHKDLNEIGSPLRKSSVFKRSPRRQQSLVIELQGITPIQEEDDDNNLVSALK